MGQSGSRRLRNTDEQTETTIVAESRTDIRTAFIVIGSNAEFDTAEALRDSLEDSEGGRVKVSDLADVSKSEGASFDEKLRRYLMTSTGVVVICSDGLKACIDGGKNVDVTINQTKITLNGSVLSKFLYDSNQNKQKFIAIASNKTHLPDALKDKEIIKISEGEVDEDKIEKAANEIRAILEGFQSA